MLNKLSIYMLLLLVCSLGHNGAKGSAVTVNDMSTFSDIKCNRTAWKGIVEPYLAAQGAALTYPANLTLQNEYMNALNTSKVWTSSHLNHIGDICSFQQFLECYENNKCVCGTGRVPYNFEQQEGTSFCLATRGSICSSDVNCATGLKCENRKTSLLKSTY